MRADKDGRDGDRKTEAAAEPLRAEKGVMQPKTAATGTLRADRDGRKGDKESSHIRLLREQGGRS